MKLLGCDKDILTGNASDFEYFDLWEQILPLAEGHFAVAEYEGELKKSGLSLPCEPYSRERSIRRWRELNSAFYGDLLTDERPYIPLTDECTEGYKISEKPCFIYDLEKNAERIFPLCNDTMGLCEEICNELKKVEADTVIIRLGVGAGEYLRPTPYLAQCAFAKKKKGEDLCSKEKNSLYFQLLILLIIALGTEKRLTPELLGDTENSLEFISYLCRRSLFFGEARVELTPSVSLSNFTTKALSFYPSIWLRPLIYHTPSEDMRSEYPIFSFCLLTQRT